MAESFLAIGHRTYICAWVLKATEEELNKIVLHRPIIHPLLFHVTVEYMASVFLYDTL
jgi:hypothetical protein